MVQYAALDAHATRVVHACMRQLVDAVAARTAARLPGGGGAPPSAAQLHAWMAASLRDGGTAAAAAAPHPAPAPAATTSAPDGAARPPPHPRSRARNSVEHSCVVVDRAGRDDFSVPVDACQPVQGGRGSVQGGRRRGGAGRSVGTARPAAHERMRGAGADSAAGSAADAQEDDDSAESTSGAIYLPHACRMAPPLPYPAPTIAADAIMHDGSLSQGLGQRRAALCGGGRKRVQAVGAGAAVTGGAGYGKGRELAAETATKAVRHDRAVVPLGVGRGRGALVGSSTKCMSRVRGAGAADRGAIPSVSRAGAQRLAGGSSRGSRGGRSSTATTRALVAAPDSPAPAGAVGQTENDFGIPEGLQKPSRRGGLSGTAGRVVDPTRREVLRGIGNSPDSVRTKGAKMSPQSRVWGGSRAGAWVSPVGKDDGWSRAAGAAGAKARGGWNGGAVCGGVPDWVGKTGDAPMRSPGLKPGQRRMRTGSKTTQRVRDMMAGEDAAARKPVAVWKRSDPAAMRLPARTVREASRETDKACRDGGVAVRCEDTSRAGEKGGDGDGEEEEDGEASPRLPWCVEQFDARAMPNMFYVRAHERAQREFGAMTPPPVRRLADVTAGSMGRLPIAAPPKSYYDVIEAYFATVEAVVDGGSSDAEWLKAWRVPEFKASALYHRMVAYYGGP